MTGQEWKRILVPEGLVEDVLKITYHFTEEQCRGLFATVETILQAETEATEYGSYKDLKATNLGEGHGNVWLLNESPKQQATVAPRSLT